MITVRYGDCRARMEPAHLVSWLFGCNEVLPGVLTIRTLEGTQSDAFSSKNVTISTESGKQGERGERYSITIGDASAELPAEWVIPWTSGLAAHRGVDLSPLLDAHIHERGRRMQALMICHQNRWLKYDGITEGNRP